MLNNFKRFTKFFISRVETESSGTKRHVRKYGAARVNRTTADWVTAPTSGNYELRSSLRVLRARSRQLSRDADYMKKFLGMVTNNVIGPKGISMQVRATGPAKSTDDALNAMVEKAWREWCQKENCSASGKLSFWQAQRLFMRTLARDGEALVRLMPSDNPFGFSIKFIDVNWLDEGYVAQLPNGNRVIMSIEVDSDYKPVAYWLTPPGYDYFYDPSKIKTRTRVPAEEMIHSFILEDEEQVRGIPWAHTAMLRMNLLKGYEEAEVVAARAEACKMGFYKPPADNEFAGDIDEEVQRVELLENAEPGILQELPPGYEFEKYDPSHPNPNVAAFIKTILRGIAAGLDVSYFSLANDLEGVNYSSARIGLLEERDIWKGMQGFAIQEFCRPVYQAWLKSAITTSKLPITAKDYDRVKEAMWRPRGWAWVDPTKDVQANVTSLENNLTTHTDVLAEQGVDLEDVLATIKREREMAKKYGVDLTVSSGKKQPANSKEKEEENEDEMS